jgi:hypothetical protein
VDALEENAAKLMDVLRTADDAGMASEDWVVFVGPQGGYQMIADYDGSLESLTWDKGATQSWRVTRRGGHLTVTGQNGHRVCELQREARSLDPRRLLPQSALYQVA